MKPAPGFHPGRFRLAPNLPGPVPLCSSSPDGRAFPKPQVSTPTPPSLPGPSPPFQPPPSRHTHTHTHLETLEHLIHQVLDLVLTELHPHDLLQVRLHEGHHQVAAKRESFLPTLAPPQPARPLTRASWLLALSRAQWTPTGRVQDQHFSGSMLRKTQMGLCSLSSKAPSPCPPLLHPLTSGSHSRDLGAPASISFCFCPNIFSRRGLCPARRAP